MSERLIQVNIDNSNRKYNLHNANIEIESRVQSEIAFVLC